MKSFFQVRYWPEGYFMSPDAIKDADASLLLSFRQAEQHLARLKAEAERIGKQFVAMGNTLKLTPNAFCFDTDDVGAHFNIKRTNYDRDVLDADKLAKLGQDIREATAEVTSLRRHVDQIGLGSAS
jgi:hypothetical protein